MDKMLERIEALMKTKFPGRSAFWRAVATGMVLALVAAWIAGAAFEGCASEVHATVTGSLS